MASGYEPFDKYNTEFRAVIREVEQQLHISEEPNNQVGLQLRKCQELLKRMKAEIKKAPDTSIKQDLVDIYKACEMQLQSYQTLYQKKELFQESNADQGESDPSKLQGGRERLRATRDQAERQNSRLADALRSIRETEEVAGGIGQELDRNRDTLQRAHGNVGKMGGMLNQANGHLKKLMRKWF
eukprot:Nitzschia sp. Nitz4//scaffold56_size114212//79739//80290//NITZ4_003959-RA/size114212-processed-gene-0.71-mRNA-1//-1//CDS//3329554733//4295//frame0